MYERKLEKDIRCPMEAGLELLSGKWKSRIICILSNTEQMRFNELKKRLENVTDAVLASTLKELIASGLVARKSYNEIPPRVEYSLTEKGRSLMPILQSICTWATDNHTSDDVIYLNQCKRPKED